MDQAAAPTINEINAALLAQYQAKQQGRTANAAEGTDSFASTLSAIERQELPPPMPLAVKKPESTTTVATTAKTETEKEEEACPAAKISRSARMACAEKATHVSYQDDDFGFDDFVDFINPLQHIPIIGTIYRELTGDTIKPEVQVAGSIGFGAVTGSLLLSAASGIASAFIEQHTGEEPTVHVAQALFGDTVETPNPVMEDKIVIADNGTVDTSERPTVEIAPETGKTAVESPQIRTALAAAQTPAEQPQKTARSAATTHMASSGVLASTGGMRIGNTIYTSPMMRSAAKIAPPSSAATKQASVSAEQETTTATIQNKEIGALIQEQAKAREQGQKLPPQLVQDMMLMALDKYQTAHALSAEQTTSVQ